MDRQVEHVEVDRIIRARELPDYVGIGGVHATRLEHEGRFPKAIWISDRAKGWLLSDLMAWIAERAAERDAP